jgi:hypothetical protein
MNSHAGEANADRAFLRRSSTTHSGVLTIPHRTQSVQPIVAAGELMDSLCFFAGGANG